MDYQPQNPQGGQNGGYPPYPYGMPVRPMPPRPKGQSMATASMVLGIISLASLLLVRITIPFLLGGIGIILAILSRGSAKRMISRAKAGLICCIAGLCLDIVFCAFAVWLVFALPSISPELTDEVNKMCEQQYGVSYDEIMEEIYDMWNMDDYPMDDFK